MEGLTGLLWCSSCLFFIFFFDFPSILLLLSLLHCRDAERKPAKKAIGDAICQQALPYCQQHVTNHTIVPPKKMSLQEFFTDECMYLSYSEKHATQQ